MPDIMHFTRIKALPEQVYAALSTEDGVRNWWTRSAALDCKVGGEGEFSFYDRKVVTRVEIDALEPSSRVAWTTMESDAPSGWVGSTISFDLARDGDETIVRFAHRNLRDGGDGFARVTSGWGYYLTSLRQYLETGTGAPHPETGVARIVAA